MVCNWYDLLKPGYDELDDVIINEACEWEEGGCTIRKQMTDINYPIESVVSEINGLIIIVSAFGDDDGKRFNDVRFL